VGTFLFLLLNLVLAPPGVGGGSGRSRLIHPEFVYTFFPA
jgi:hypothetical protein